MGWTITDRPKPKGVSVEQFLINEGVLRWSDETPATFRVLASALVRLRTFYAAVEQIDKATGERQVWAAVILVDPRKDSFGWKDMDETCGPCEAECPAKILDLLTPTDSDYANEWRARCRENLERSKRASAQARAIKVGDTIEYGGHTYTVLRSLGRKGFTVSGASGIYRMKATQLREAKLVNAQPEPEPEDKPAQPEPVQEQLPL